MEISADKNNSKYHVLLGDFPFTNYPNHSQIKLENTLFLQTSHIYDPFLGQCNMITLPTVN